jgi:hypothetical protein
VTYPLKTLDAGITFRRPYPDLVSEIEEREAARSNGYTWEAWHLLERPARVAGIAWTRAKRYIEMHQQDAADSEMKRTHKAQAAKQKASAPRVNRARGRRR